VGGRLGRPIQGGKQEKGKKMNQPFAISLGKTLEKAESSLGIVYRKKRRFLRKGNDQEKKRG